MKSWTVAWIMLLVLFVVGIVMLARDGHCKETEKSAPTVVIDEDKITITPVKAEKGPEVILGRVWVKKAAFKSSSAVSTVTKTKKSAAVKAKQIKGVKLFCCADDGEWCDVGCCPEGKQYGSAGGLCYPTMSACSASGTGQYHTCNTTAWCGG